MVLFSILFNASDLFGEDFGNVATLTEVVDSTPYRGSPIYLRSESHGADGLSVQRCCLRRCVPDSSAMDELCVRTVL
jgi:hypothetical protein